MANPSALKRKRDEQPRSNVTRAALLTLERGDPVLVDCYYHSDEMVACNFPDDAGNPY